MDQVENSHDENRLLSFKLSISMHWNIVNLYGYLSALFHIKYTTKYIWEKKRPILNCQKLFLEEG